MPEDMVDGKKFAKMILFAFVMLAMAFCSIATAYGAVVNGALR